MNHLMYAYFCACSKFNVKCLLLSEITATLTADKNYALRMVESSFAFHLYIDNARKRSMFCRESHIPISSCVHQNHVCHVIFENKLNEDKTT